MISSEIDCIFFTDCGGCKNPKIYEMYKTNIFQKICNFIVFKIFKMETQCALYGHPHRICEFQTKKSFRISSSIEIPPPPPKRKIKEGVKIVE